MYVGSLSKGWFAVKRGLSIVTTLLLLGLGGYLSWLIGKDMLMHLPQPQLADTLKIVGIATLKFAGVWATMLLIGALTARKTFTSTINFLRNSIVLFMTLALGGGSVYLFAQGFIDPAHSKTNSLLAVVGFFAACFAWYVIERILGTILPDLSKPSKHYDPARHHKGGMDYQLDDA